MYVDEELSIISIVIINWYCKIFLTLGEPFTGGQWELRSVLVRLSQTPESHKKGNSLKLTPASGSWFNRPAYFV